MNAVQAITIKDAEADLRRLKEWNELTQEEQANVSSQIESLKIETEKNISGLKQLVTQEFNIYATIQDLRKRIVAMGDERAAKKEKERLEKAKENNTYLKTFSIPPKIISLQQLNDMLKTMEQLRVDAIKHDKFEIRFIVDAASE